MSRVVKKSNNLDKEMMKSMLANPFYCLPKVAEVFCIEHKPMVSEKEWINAAKRVIEQEGVEEFLHQLLENLKGNYVTEDFSIKNKPFLINTDN